MNVAEVALTFDQIAFVRQHHECVANRGVPVGVKLHGISNHVRHLHEPSVVDAMQRPQNAALDRLEAVGQGGDGAIANDIGGVFEEAGVYPAMQRQVDLAGLEWRMDHDRHLFGKNMARAVAVAIGARSGRGDLAVGGGGIREG